MRITDKQQEGSCGEEPIREAASCKTARRFFAFPCFQPTNKPTRVEIHRLCLRGMQSSANVSNNMNFNVKFSWFFFFFFFFFLPERAPETR